MNARILLATLAALLAVSARGQAQDAAWKPAPSPLVTRWAKEVRPDRARPEYPRPQFQRKEWRSLNGLWEFAFDDANRGIAEGWKSGHPLPERILVPFTFEAALSGIGKGAEVHERVWYRRSFEVPASWRGRRTRLNFNACDWESTVWVDGTQVGTHRGGYEPFSFDVTDALKPGGSHELVVAVYDPADPRQGAYQPKGKQLGSRGIWYTRTTGIWQTVWLEPRDPAAPEIETLRAEVDPETRAGQVTASFRFGSASPDTLQLVVSRGGTQSIAEVSAASSGDATRNVTVQLRGSELWSPEKPVLYDVTLRAKRGGHVIDEVKSYTAFRRYDIRNGRLALNGKPYFLRGVLDQGYWPDGILTPPSEAAIKAEVEMTKKLGFNMARKHVKVEDPRWYYWCDRLGLAVWQDMPSSHNLASDEAKANFRREWQGAMRATASYPCVMHWIPFNENWGNPGAFQDEIVTLTRSLDATRPITDASGWTQRGLTDVIDAHDYGNNLLRQAVQNPVKPKVVGEYGGIALGVPEHTWTTGWGYQTARDPEGLLHRIRFQTSQLYEAANLSGFVYTQLTDVEQELNGLLTYDRQPKADPAKVAAIFEGRQRYQTNGGFLRSWLVLGPIPTGKQLRTADDNAQNRAVLDQILREPYLPDEASLRPTEGAGVDVRGQHLAWRRVRLTGNDLDFHPVFGGQTQNAVAYAVAEFEVPGEIKNATLLFGSDDGARVWLDGTEVHSVSRIRGVAPDDDTVRGITLKPGRHTVVVKVAQGVGGWGLALRFEKPDGTMLEPTQP